MSPIRGDELPEPTTPVSVDQLWTRGGFPDSLLAPSDAESATWREHFLRSCLERDVPMFAPRMPSETLTSASQSCS